MNRIQNRIKNLRSKYKEEITFFFHNLNIKKKQIIFSNIYYRIGIYNIKLRNIN